jgi:hypothetical protein
MEYLQLRARAADSTIWAFDEKGRPFRLGIGLPGTIAGACAGRS